MDTATATTTPLPRAGTTLTHWYIVPSFTLGTANMKQIDPYTYWFNTPGMSENGNTPMVFPGYHQTDVIRAKA